MSDGTEAGEAIAVRQVGRNHQLDLLRIVFATLVLLSHAPEIVDHNRSREILSRVTRSPVSFGELAVDGFFLLSGFLIVQSWQRDPEFLNFIWKRVLRIVPGYMVAIVISVTAVGWLAPGVPHFFHLLDHHFVDSVLMLREPVTPPVFPGTTIGGANGALWTIFYEFHCYLAVALLGLCGAVRRPLFWVIAGVLLFAGSLSPSLQHALDGHTFFLRFFGYTKELCRLGACFFLGGVFYLYERRIPFRPVLGCLAAALLVGDAVIYPRSFQIALVICGGYLMFYLRTLKLRKLDWMRRFPDISYGMYLYGWPVEALWVWFHPHAPWQTFFGATAICVVLGWLSWHFVERPMLRLKRRATAPLPAG